MARTGAYIKFPVDGNVLEGLDSGRLTIGEGTLIQTDCWLTLAPEARITIGAHCVLNRGLMLASVELIEIGDHVLFAQNCFLGDADHGYDEPTIPITQQRAVPRGPVRIGANCWFGVNCVVTGGVEIGDRCVIGANSVVTSNLPSGVIAAGAPARMIRAIQFRESD